MKETGISFKRVYNFKDPDARGRTSLLICTVLSGIIAQLVGGMFYTAFLTEHNINTVSIGILSFLPYIANLVVIFVPSLLNKFPKRRGILAFVKIMYYLCVTVGITLLPTLVKNESARLLGLVIITFVSHVFNAVASVGYTAWHVSFLPEEYRAYQLSAGQFASALISGIFVLASGAISDMLVSMGGARIGFITGLRYFALLIAVCDVICLSLPREIEYKKADTPHLIDVFSKPFKNKKYMLTMLIIFAYNFATGIHSSFAQVYMLQNIEISLFFWNFLICTYGLFFIFFTGFWQKRIKKTSWFTTYAISMLIFAPMQILYGFAQPDTHVPMLLFVKFSQHFAAVGVNVTFANFQYIHLPVGDRENYTSFYLVLVYTASLLGTVYGTIFTSFTENFSFTAFGYTYQTGTPLLIIMSGVIMLGTAVYALAFRKKLEPDRLAE
ncbi:MAG: MFS transporter [Ruminococcaceae bacterium]|nr:MFS transporter [Oscillospiraceae bacterium]